MKVILFLSLGKFPGHYQHVLKFPALNVILKPLLPYTQAHNFHMICLSLIKKPQALSAKFQSDIQQWMDSVLVLLSDCHEKLQKFWTHLFSSLPFSFFFSFFPLELDKHVCCKTTNTYLHTHLQEDFKRLLCTC